MTKFDENIDALTNKLNATLKAKNHDYGDSYADSVEEFGKVIMPIRISDKLSRLKTLLNSDDQKVNDESVEDTLLDLAGYAILGLEYLRRNKEVNEFPWKKIVETGLIEKIIMKKIYLVESFNYKDEYGATFSDDFVVISESEDEAKRLVMDDYLVKPTGLHLKATEIVPEENSGIILQSHWSLCDG